VRVQIPPPAPDARLRPVEDMTASGSLWVVTLCSNTSTGFTWEAPVYDHAALRLVRVVSTPPGTGLAGAAGTQTWTIRTLTPGSYRVLFACSRPWAGGEKGLWRLALTTIVRA
jgi:predicted secreted protein